MRDRFKRVDDHAGDMVIFMHSKHDYSFPLYVNPEELTWKMGDHVRDISENVGGIVESNFQAEFDSLQCSGTTGGLCHPEFGFTGYKREDSEVYKKFLKFLNIFKNNGDVYDRNGILIKSYYLGISFLGVYWKGKFTSFSFSEKDEGTFQFELEFEFKIYDTDLKVVEYV